MIVPDEREAPIDPTIYRKSLNRYQQAFDALVEQLNRQNRSGILIFEGWGAAGKGDIIRLLTARLDPRHYSVHANHRPAGAELNHHYLWRYWRQIPELGHLAVIDRSWYRRVLIDRVEGNCIQQEWERAYQEINQVERQINDFGCIFIKFWLQISPEEQLRRFESRMNDDSRRWKITRDDWQLRDRWPEYQSAVDDMLAATSTVYAPWTVIDSDVRFHANLQTFQTVVSIFSDELKYNLSKPEGKGRGKKAAGQKPR